MGHQVLELLRTGGWQEQQHRGIRRQTQTAPRLLPAGQVPDAVQQWMPHPGDICATGGIKLRLRRENRQDPIGETQQLCGAAIAETPGPLLGSDVVRDRQLCVLLPQLASQTHIRPHVINQHHTVEGAGPQHPVHPRLKPQGGKNQRDCLPEANGAHRCRVLQQFRAGLLHPHSTKGQQLKADAAPRCFPAQGIDQQAALQITGYFTGADQQPHHQRLPRAGIGPRRPLLIDASRKLQRCSAAGRSSCSRACFRPSAIT